MNAEQLEYAVPSDPPFNPYAPFSEGDESAISSPSSSTSSGLSPAPADTQPLPFQQSAPPPPPSPLPILPLKPFPGGSISQPLRPQLQASELQPGDSLPAVSRTTSRSVGKQDTDLGAAKADRLIESSQLSDSNLSAAEAAQILANVSIEWGQIKEETGRHMVCIDS